MRCAFGQTWTGSNCTGTATNTTYNTWIQSVNLTQTFAGYSDWRLPSIRELMTIVDRTRSSPAIDPVAFPGAPSGGLFWSSSPHASISGNAWYVNFADGVVDYNTGALTGDARLVRAGQTSAMLSLARPDADYTDHGDGTVTHKPTGLMWKRCAEGQAWGGGTCTGTASSFTYDLAVAQTSSFAGYTDWRTPTVGELTSLVDYAKTSPPINSTMFPNTPNSNFWSSSPYASNLNMAWYVKLVDGWVYTYNRSYSYPVRLVRAGQSSGTLSANLISGWNLVGNGSSGTLDVASAFGNANNVTTVWKWIASTAKWAFYAPSQTDGGAAYASSKGYDFLTTINGGEGYWVNAKAVFPVPGASGTPVTAVSFQTPLNGTGTLIAGWNLIAIGESKTPSDFNKALSTTPPAQGVTPTNVTTLWAWDAGLSQWYFYAPSLEAQGGTALKDYASGKGYLDFTTANKTLGSGTGFWVNKP